MKMRQFAVTLLLLTGCAAQAGAQSFLDELKGKKTGEGTVTVNQSASIDELVNNAKLVKTQPAAPARQPEEGKAAAATGTEHRPGQAAKAPDDSAAREQRHTAGEAQAGDTPTVNTGKKVMVNSRKVTGYRIQVFAGGNSHEDKLKAERTGSDVKAKFPELPVYVHFYSPRWICRVGNFRTYQEAEVVLNKLKGMGYKHACILKGKITVAY